MNLDIKENELIRKDGIQLLKKEVYRNITSEYGIKLRMNRSIQVEKVFANIKGNFKFDKFRRRCINKYRCEFSLYTLGHILIL